MKTGEPLARCCWQFSAWRFPNWGFLRGDIRRLFLYNRHGINAFAKMLDGVVHGDAHQPGLEVTGGAVGVGAFHRLEERLVRQVLRQRQVIDIAVAKPDHPSDVGRIHPFPKCRILHFFALFMMMTQK